MNDKIVELIKRIFPCLFRRENELIEKMLVLTEEINEFKDKPKLKLCNGYCEFEIRAVGTEKGLSKDEIDLLVYKYSYRMTYKQLSAKYYNVDNMSQSKLEKLVPKARKKWET